MKFNELRETWQSQDGNETIPINVSTISKLIRREERYWNFILLRRDIGEILAGLLASLAFLYGAVFKDIFWLFPMVLASLFVCGFFIVDRARQRKRQPSQDQPLVEFIEKSIAQNDHQIWLLRNIMWWYLLPLGISMLIFLGSCLFSLLQDGLATSIDYWALAFIIAIASAAIMFFWWIYSLNQRAVKRELLPRKKALKDLLDEYLATGESEAQ